MTLSFLISENQWKVQACKREPQILFHIFTWNIFVLQARAFFWDSSIRLCLITLRHYRSLEGMSNIPWVNWLDYESWKCSIQTRNPVYYWNLYSTTLKYYQCSRIQIQLHARINIIYSSFRKSKQNLTQFHMLLHQIISM